MSDLQLAQRGGSGSQRAVIIDAFKISLDVQLNLSSLTIRSIQLQMIMIR
jgi:hypothetical protein